MEDFRGMLSRMESSNNLLRVKKEVDLRYISAIIAKAKEPVLFEKITGYTMPVVGGIFGTRKSLAAALNWPSAQLGTKFLTGINRQIEPVLIKNAPVQEIVFTGAEVDLTELPIPFLSEKDGGPYISSGIVIAKDSDYGLNAGAYRLMFRTKNETGIDLVSPSGLRLYYQKCLEQKKTLEVAVAIGTHAYEMLAATYKAPLGCNELAIAGGLHQEPLQLVQCKTVDLPVPAHAEIVLEGELLRTGWTVDEGPFGEFAGMTGDLKWNPIFKVTAVTMRKNPIFYSLQMPWENSWLGAPPTEAEVWKILQCAGINATAVRVLEGSACRFSVVVSIKKRPGEGKNAIQALLALPEVKHAVVTDDDIDIFDDVQLEWAKTFRVQADKDVIILSGLKAKHVDPSVRPWELPKGVLPLTAKMGIDATIPEGIPYRYYERIRPAFLDEVALEDYM